MAFTVAPPLSPFTLQRMKVGILTFHCAHNYGAVLQCYAMQEYLRSIGHEVEIINYRPAYLLRQYRVFRKRVKFHGVVLPYVKNLIKELIVFPARCRRWRGFQAFINNRLSLSKPVYDISSIPSDYDVYLVGSDQVWNPIITEGLDGVYFCDFSFEKGCKKYLSYAASMEITSLDSNTRQFFSRKLNNFDTIGVREEYMKALLSPLTDRPIQQVLDPTLMVPPGVWTKLASKPIIPERYVLVYQVQYDEKTLRVAQHIAEQISAKVVMVLAEIKYETRWGRKDDTPEDFVTLFRNADCVVTTSFHGTAFSLIFNKPFYTARLNIGWDTRSISLLNQIGLQDRLIDVTSKPEFSEIDYSKVNPKLEKLRQESRDFLTTAL